MPRRKSTPPKSPPLTPRDLSDLRLNEQARQLFNAIQAYRREIIFAPPRPDLVYHYTSAQGLRGIVENDRLWATHVRCLNDFREIEHGCDVVRATLTKQREGKASEVVREFLDLALTSFNLNEQLDVCVACFSENGDLLSQWKMYGDDARGFSIGVPWERLLNLGGAGFKYFVSRVIYERTTQEAVVGEILGRTLAGLNALTKDLTHDAAVPWIRQCCKVFQDSVWMMLVVFKDPAFAAEREWRAIKVVTADVVEAVKYRDVAGQRAPYVELDFEGSFLLKGEKMPIRRVYLGPTATAEAIAAIKSVLSTHGHEHVEFVSSKVPLRRP